MSSPNKVTIQPITLSPDDIVGADDVSVNDKILVNYKERTNENGEKLWYGALLVSKSDVFRETAGRWSVIYDDTPGRVLTTFSRLCTAYPTKDRKICKRLREELKQKQKKYNKMQLTLRTLKEALHRSLTKTEEGVVNCSICYEKISKSSGIRVSTCRSKDCCKIQCHTCYGHTLRSGKCPFCRTHI